MLVDGSGVRRGWVARGRRTGRTRAAEHDIGGGDAEAVEAADVDVGEAADVDVTDLAAAVADE
eukprot:gene14530-30926_t